MRHLNKGIVLICFLSSHGLAQAPEVSRTETISIEARQIESTQNATSINDRLHDQLSAIRTMQSGFTQQTVDAANSLVQENEGVLSIATKARFIVKTQSPFEQTLVSNGSSFWTYDEALDQVIITQLDNDVNKVPILLLGNDDPTLLDAYHVSWYEEDASSFDAQQLVTYYVLEPKANDALFQVLSIAFSGDLPKEISIKDTLGQQTRILFYNTSVNEPIEDATFMFQIPSGVDVIDDRG
jgi:outer membrane lipoprotein carrier protein